MDSTRIRSSAPPATVAEWAAYEAQERRLGRVFVPRRFTPAAQVNGQDVERVDRAWPRCPWTGCDHQAFNTHPPYHVLDPSPCLSECYMTSGIDRPIGVAWPCADGVCGAAAVSPGLEKHVAHGYVTSAQGVRRPCACPCHVESRKD